MGELTGEVWEAGVAIQYTVRDSASLTGETYFMIEKLIDATTSNVRYFRENLIDMCVGRLNSCVDRFVKKAVELELKEFHVRGPSVVYTVEITGARKLYESTTYEYSYY